MDRIDKLLEYINKTNSEMTRERLIEELVKCQYSAVSLIMTFENSQPKILK